MLLFSIYAKDKYRQLCTIALSESKSEERGVPLSTKEHGSESKKTGQGNNVSLLLR